MEWMKLPRHTAAPSDRERRFPCVCPSLGSPAPSNWTACGKLKPRHWAQPGPHPSTQTSRSVAASGTEVLISPNCHRYLDKITFEHIWILCRRIFSDTEEWKHYPPCTFSRVISKTVKKEFFFHECPPPEIISSYKSSWIIFWGLNIFFLRHPLFKMGHFLMILSSYF